MSWEAFLAERPLAVIATAGPDGTPHAVPVEVVVRDGLVYVWAEGGSVKVRNATREGRAALVAYKGHSFVLVRGPARVLGPDDPAYRDIAQAFLAKYERDEEYGNDALIEITPERVTARI